MGYLNTNFGSIVMIWQWLGLEWIRIRSCVSSLFYIMQTCENEVFLPAITNVGLIANLALKEKMKLLGASQILPKAMGVVWCYAGKRARCLGS